MIRLENVTKTYRGAGASALAEVQLQIDRGEFVFLVGSSGSGKSSLLRLMLREEKPDSGDLFVLGENLRTLPQRRVASYRRKLGVVFQDFRLLPNKTVAENVAFALEVIGRPKAQITKVVPEVLEVVGLSGKEHRRPDELSGGEQQRVAIARAFVNRPMLLIADEPTGNLDPETSIGIMQLLYRINRTGTTVIMATHDREMVDKMQMRVIALENGKVVRDQRQASYARSDS